MRWICLVMMLFWIGGCVDGPMAAPMSAQQVRERGLAEQKVRRAFLRLTALERSPVLVMVDYDRRATAYGWKEGQIVVTTGMVELLSEDELSAAIAHETGHLIMEGKVRVRGIGATGYGVSGEFLADAIGCDILRASGMSPALMISTLEKLGEANPGATHGQMDVRVRALRTASAQGQPAGG